VIDGRTECYYRAKTIQNHLTFKKKSNILENIQSRFHKIRNSKFTKCLKKIRNEFHSKKILFRKFRVSHTTNVYKEYFCT
jgi:hypothetical protein